MTRLAAPAWAMSFRACFERHLVGPPDNLQQAVVAETEARKPAGRNEAELRGVVLSRWHIEARDLTLAQVALANAIAFDEEGEVA